MQTLKGRLFVLIGAAAAVILLMFAMGTLAKKMQKQEHNTLTGDFAAQRYPYRQLDARGKELYTALYEGISDYQTKITLPATYTAEEYRRVYLTVATQEPELFYLDRTYETAAEMKSVSMYYTYDREAAEKMQKQMEREADRIISSLSSTQNEAQKLLMIHDRICAGCRYEKTLNSDNAYGCLIEGAAQCEGYAMAFLYVARRAGLEMMCVPGKTDKGEAHIWNIAKIGGNYYNMDITWDDDDTYEGETAHVCFAVPDDAFEDHIPEKETFLPPPCVDRMQTYYQMRGFTLNEIVRLPEILRSWRGISPGRMIEFQCIGSEVYEQAKNALRSDPNLSSVLFEVTGIDTPTIVADKNRNAIVIMT